MQTAYALYAGGFLCGPLIIAAVIMSYVKRGEMRGSWLDAHYDWLIDTFWAGLIGSVLLFVASMVMGAVFAPVGMILMILLMVAGAGWPIYRLVVGYTAFSEGRAPRGVISPPDW
ncbi:MAG TPA: hypothetical protein VFS20_19950 [Longimicrobium sp.]|nr:hypothetical protein [Longimicrobium sp.]